MHGYVYFLIFYINESLFLEGQWTSNVRSTTETTLNTLTPSSTPSSGHVTTTLVGRSVANVLSLISHTDTNKMFVIHYTE